ncbi:hypothetical protein F4782DRAFT_548773 [Xylaria castorea]|nr:hypothetical protein F4782DRAFT_548773 [Xylaria castorea]
MVHHRSYSDDKSSMLSTYNSAEKTPLTVTSSRSSPPQSRGQSPVGLPFHQKTQFPFSKEQKDILPLPDSTSSSSNFDGRDQSTPVNANCAKALQDDLACPKRNEATEINIFEQGDRSMPVESTATNSQTFLSLDTVGGMFDKLDGPSVGESGLFACSDDSSDEDLDLDLEQYADQFLSDKFGVSLSRLRRPHRIIYAFQQVKNNKDSQSERVDGGDTYHSTGGDHTYSIAGSSSTLAGIKRPSQDTVASEGFSGSSILAKTRRYKKRRIEGDFSCPFRKRNPRRFNVRDHEQCANRSYRDISALK